MKKYPLEQYIEDSALNSIGTNPTEKDKRFSDLKQPEVIRKNRKEIQKEVKTKKRGFRHPAKCVIII